MKLYFIILICIFCFNKTDLTVLKSSSQKWSSGKGISQGQKYRIMLITNRNSKDLKIDQLWVGDRFLKSKVFLYRGTAAEKEFSKGDTILLVADDLIMLDEERNIIENQDSSIVIPYKYNGAGLIGYKVRNKRKYIEVNEFSIIKPLFYP